MNIGTLDNYFVFVVWTKCQNKISKAIHKYLFNISVLSFYALYIFSSLCRLHPDWSLYAWRKSRNAFLQKRQGRWSALTRQPLTSHHICFYSDPEKHTSQEFGVERRDLWSTHSNGCPLGGSTQTYMSGFLRALPLSGHPLEGTGLRTAEHLLGWHELPNQHFMPIST